MNSIHDKKIIFTVTPGRSGSRYLANLLAAVPSVTARHEPQPNFVNVFRRSQSDPQIAYNFLRNQKIPAIERESSPIYAETNHLICKGFFEPAIRLGLRPALVVLRRPPRQVAWSLIERRCVPYRTHNGRAWLFQPTDHNVLPLLRWESASDYQLCFWYVLEIERRQRYYAALWREQNMPVVDITNTELNDWNAFSQLLDTLIGIKADADLRAAHHRISSQQHNETSRRLEIKHNLDQAEEEVWDRVSHFDPWLRGHVEARYDSMRQPGTSFLTTGAAAD